ncbi:MAG: radical SAM family heme chaperone HemW [Limnobacter sp.]|nr:radical SAM family heme chaperone HemW [Limnobacter sp.]
MNLVTQIFKPTQIALPALPPLGLYIHLPWCVRKCPYCDFNSHLAPESPFKAIAINKLGGGHELGKKQADSLPPDIQKRYLRALINDLDQQLPKVWGRKLHSVFIGGGTPSLFAPELIDELLGAVRARFGMPVTGEITMEANPGTFEQERFEGFKQAGVTRLSLGVQSFNSSALQALGRVHNAEQATRAVESAVQLFDHVNIDLMYGLPLGPEGVQSVQQAISDVQAAIQLRPDHLSLYQLTLEPNTQFEAKPPLLPELDVLIELEQAVHQEVKKAGYERYEVSAFARAGCQSQHNVNYWQFGDYLGIGAGAHAKISFANRIERENRLRNPQAYMQAVEQGDEFFESRELTVADLPFEFMLNALRLTGGVPEQYFTERCGRPVSDLQRPLKLGLEKGLISPEPGRFKATSRGFDFLNDLQQLFLGEE